MVKLKLGQRLIQSRPRVRVAFPQRHVVNHLQAKGLVVSPTQVMPTTGKTIRKSPANRSRDAKRQQIVCAPFGDTFVHITDVLQPTNHNDLDLRRSHPLLAGARDCGSCQNQRISSTQEKRDGQRDHLRLLVIEVGGVHSLRRTRQNAYNKVSHRGREVCRY